MYNTYYLNHTCLHINNASVSIYVHVFLQLLMCGTETVSYDDLKKHAVVSNCSFNPAFQTVVSWFWVVVSNFVPEEMARLLQFVTGCSQLPPGGVQGAEPQVSDHACTHARPFALSTHLVSGDS